jgi:hypothetical protein
MSAKKFAGVTPSEFVIEALTGESPVARSTGKEITDPPPAMPFMRPTNKPAMAMSKNSSII